MGYRSTNAAGIVHFGGDIVSGAQDGAGIRLGSASTGTGSTVIIESVPTDACCA